MAVVCWLQEELRGASVSQFLMQDATRLNYCLDSVMTSERPSGDHRFPKAERLKKKKSIEELFAKGSSFSFYPFRIISIPREATIFCELPMDAALPKVLISVPKRQVRKAHQRNLVKRRIKEAYRQLRPEFADILSSCNAPPAHIAFIYVTRELHSYKLISRKLKSALERLASKDPESAA